MKFKSKIGDGAFIGVLCFAVLTLSMYIVWVVSTVWWPAILLTVIMSAVIVPIYFATSYEIDKDDLKIYSGVIGKKIDYYQIISATDADCIKPSFALSSQRICIRYFEDEKVKETYISPVNREEFRIRLNEAMQKSLAKARRPETEEEKAQFDAIEHLKQSFAIEHVNKAEEKAKQSKAEAKNKKSQAELDKEVKKLDDVFSGNVNRDDVVLSKKQEAKLEKRQKAEEKLQKKTLKMAKKSSNKQKTELTQNAKTAEEVAKQKEAEKEALRKAIRGEKIAPKENKKEKKAQEKKDKGLNKIVNKASKDNKKKHKIKKVNVR